MSLTPPTRDNGPMDIFQRVKSTTRGSIVPEFERLAAQMNPAPEASNRVQTVFVFTGGEYGRGGVA